MVGVLRRHAAGHLQTDDLRGPATSRRGSVFPTGGDRALGRCSASHRGRHRPRGVPSGSPGCRQMVFHPPDAIRQALDARRPAGPALPGQYFDTCFDFILRGLGPPFPRNPQMNTRTVLAAVLRHRRPPGRLFEARTRGRAAATGGGVLLAPARGGADCPTQARSGRVTSRIWPSASAARSSSGQVDVGRW